MKKYLIVGLGNIGAKYDETRHNIGFKILDELASSEEISFESEKLGAVSTFKFKGRTFILLKPSTYMNLSGKSVKYWLTKENIPLENLLVICDDLNLDFGSIRLKVKGSDGEIATISIYYNKKGHFKRPTLMKSEPKEFGDEVLEVLTSNNSITDFTQSPLIVPVFYNFAKNSSKFSEIYYTISKETNKLQSIQTE